MNGNVIRRSLDRVEFFEIDGKRYKVEYLRVEKDNVSKVDSVCISTEYRLKYFEINDDTEIINFIRRNEKNLL